VTKGVESVVPLRVGCQLQDVLGPGGEPVGDGPGREETVVGELGGLFAEVVDELRDSSGHGDGKQRAGSCSHWSSAAVRLASVGGCWWLPVQPQLQASNAAVSWVQVEVRVPPGRRRAA
jgi:hypothetical protein